RDRFDAEAAQECDATVGGDSSPGKRGRRSLSRRHRRPVSRTARRVDGDEVERGLRETGSGGRSVRERREHYRECDHQAHLTIAYVSFIKNSRPFPMTATLAFVIILVLLALVFDYINGFHDAANSIATVVSTRVLSPGMAVIWAAFFNFVAFAVFGTRVAKSIGDGVRMDLITPELRLYVLLAALLGAIIWN